MAIGVWLAVHRKRNEVVAHYIGKMDLPDPLIKRYKQVENHHMQIIATHGNYSYDKIIPKNIKHIVEKAETCLVEAQNSSLRAMLVRLTRRTKRYSKCPQMLRMSFSIWQLKNLVLSIYA